jgi:hypothetical protein
MPADLKYNNVLRSFSGDAFMLGQCVKYKLGEWADAAETEIRWSLAPSMYATTIHAINSCVLKLSKLTVATSVYRGVAGMRLPASFFERNADNIAGGVEYGFSSTTRKRETAIFYAKSSEANVASTVLEAEMGMVDRGADVCRRRLERWSFVPPLKDQGSRLSCGRSALYHNSRRRRKSCTAHSRGWR